jgi:hypothetical protein
LVMTFDPFATRPRNGVELASTPESMTATAAPSPSYGTPNERRSLSPISEPVDDPARLATVLNSQTP